MTIFRVVKNKDNPYVMINKHSLNNDGLSWKAKGILCYLLGLPDDFVIHISELVRHASEGEKSLRSGLKELTDGGYLFRQQVRDSNGRFNEYETFVYEVPQPIPPPTQNGDTVSQNRHAEKRNSVEGDADNRALLSNKIQLSNKIHNKEVLKKSPQGKATLLGGDAILTDEYRQVAMERGIHSDWIDLRWKDFKDYWTSGGTAKYFKKDWLATWRNNCSAATSKFMYPCPAGVGGTTVSSGSAESALVFNEGNVEYASETPDGPKRVPLYADPTIGGAFRRYDKQGIEWNYTYGQWHRTGRKFMNDFPAKASVYANLPSMSGGFDDD